MEVSGKCLDRRRLSFVWGLSGSKLVLDLSQISDTSTSASFEPSCRTSSKSKDLNEFSNAGNLMIFEIRRKEEKDKKLELFPRLTQKIFMFKVFPNICPDEMKTY